MDICDPYFGLTREHPPGEESKIAFDEYRVAEHLSEAINQVRRCEQGTLRAASDGRAFETLRQCSLKTVRARALKETRWHFTSLPKREANRSPLRYSG